MYIYIYMVIHLSMRAPITSTPLQSPSTKPPELSVGRSKGAIRGRCGHHLAVDFFHSKALGVRGWEFMVRIQSLGITWRSIRIFAYPSALGVWGLALYRDPNLTRVWLVVTIRRRPNIRQNQHKP